MKNTDLVQLLRELGRFCENSPLEGAIDLAGRAYTAAAEEIEGRRAPTDEEIIKFWNCHCSTPTATGIIKLARFGGGEGK